MVGDAAHPVAVAAEPVAQGAGQRDGRVAVVVLAAERLAQLRVPVAGDAHGGAGGLANAHDHVGHLQTRRPGGLGISQLGVEAHRVGEPRGGQVG